MPVKSFEPRRKRSVQTFLPYADFEVSARVLDRQRLGKQRVEALVLLRICRDDKKRWANHPLRIMWMYNLEALAYYGVVICEEWIGRGYKDTCKEKILEVNQELDGPILEDLRHKYNRRAGGFLPSWFGYEPFHASHRSNLLRKDEDHYSAFGWTDPNDLKYVWLVPDKVTR